jgi:hypothetical protein
MASLAGHGKEAWFAVRAFFTWNIHVNIEQFNNSEHNSYSKEVFQRSKTF